MGVLTNRLESEASMVSPITTITIMKAGDKETDEYKPSSALPGRNGSETYTVVHALCGSFCEVVLICFRVSIATIKTTVNI